MDRATCHVLYVNRNVRQRRLVRSLRDSSQDKSSENVFNWEVDDIRQQIQPLLDTFGDVHVCATGGDCLAKLFELQDGSMFDMKPTMVLLDLPHNERIPEFRTVISSSSPTGDTVSEEIDIHTPDEDLYGLGLLQKIITEAHVRSMSKLIIPIIMINQSQSDQSSKEPMTDGPAENTTNPNELTSHRPLIRRCLDLGAVDVVLSPLDSKCMAGLEICAYRAHRDAAKEQQTMLEVRQGRKRSWVGVNEEKPFAYLREAMVSGLMNGICRLSPNHDQISHASIAVSTARRVEIAAAVGDWRFCAHDFNDDELLVAAMEIFKHALAMPELEKYRIPADQLVSYLVECRSAYNTFVPYHNFRHVVDVLQATFNFLVHIGAVPQYPDDAASPVVVDKSPMASLITPFEALTLLITAIGHDVGHPGVNNGFLVKLNAPLAQLYNDRSVLESFHCAAYSQILRRYWPAAFEDGKMRNLMISSILATDMQLHFDYMKRLGDVQEKLTANNSVDGWNGRQLEDHRSLACSLLIKCADISNVARGHTAAVSWMHILSDEFARQASMEAELGIPTSLIAPPNKDPASMAQAQLGFMNLFAIPLFQGIADIMPAMQYTVEELEYNKSLFEIKLQEEKSKQLLEDPTRKRLMRDGTFSPRTMSFVVPMDSSSEKDLASQAEAGNSVDRNLDTTPVARLQVPMPPLPRVEPDGNDQERSFPLDQPQAPLADVPRSMGDYKHPNGSVSSFDAVRELANSDPFHCRNRGDSYPDVKTFPNSKQRCSETTEGSVSGAFSGDWASQATSATTGKVPMSPSTRGTSIVSGDSGDHPIGIPGINVSAPSLKDSPVTIEQDNYVLDEESSSNFSNGGSLGKAEGKSLKKKPSRFRMKDFSFFRRHKGTSAPNAAAEPTG